MNNNNRTWTLITLISTVILTVNISGFKITFNPTDTLTDLSSFLDKNLLNLIKYSFKHEAFWPILIAFRQAKYYNFPLTFAGVLGFMECSKLLEIIQNEEFPVKEIFNVEILNYERLSSCLSGLPIEFFKDRLQIYPIESKDFKMSDWGLEKSFEFLKLSFHNPKLTTNWYSWTCDKHAFSPSNQNQSNEPILPRDTRE